MARVAREDIREDRDIVLYTVPRWGAIHTEFPTMENMIR